MNVLRGARRVLIVLLCLTVLPLAVHAGVYRYMTPWPTSWRHADWTSAGVLAPAAASEEAFLGVYAARTGGWKGVFAVHSWIVTKPAGARRYSRYDVVGWGDPVRRDAYPPDGRWFSNAPRAIAVLTGDEAAVAIPRIERAVADYPFAKRGDYRIWPGPNSNSFVAHVLAEVPELRIQLPPEALGPRLPDDGAVGGPDAEPHRRLRQPRRLSRPDARLGGGHRDQRARRRHRARPAPPGDQAARFRADRDVTEMRRRGGSVSI